MMDGQGCRKQNYGDDDADVDDRARRDEDDQELCCAVVISDSAFSLS